MSVLEFRFNTAFGFTGNAKKVQIYSISLEDQAQYTHCDVFLEFTSLCYDVL